MRKLAAAMLLILGCASAARAGGDVKTPPYWASISASEARMRTGPGRNYPVSWLYRRADLPIRVVEIYKTWRKVEDPGGEKGWLLVNLLSDQRTGFVTGKEAVLRASPDRSARVLWRVAPGVVGKVSACESGWCTFDVGGREGHIEVADLWGVSPGEQVR